MTSWVLIAVAGLPSGACPSSVVSIGPRVTQTGAGPKLTKGGLAENQLTRKDVQRKYFSEKSHDFGTLLNASLVT